MKNIATPRLYGSAYHKISTCKFFGATSNIPGLAKIAKPRERPGWPKNRAMLTLSANVDRCEVQSDETC